MSIFIDTPFDYSINQVHRDGNGRYLIVDLEANSTRIVLINVYAPNSDDANFFLELQDKIVNLGCDNIIWGGDFNFVFRIELDKRGGAKTTHFKCRQTVLDWIAENNYVDIWRAQHEGALKFKWVSNLRARTGDGKNSKQGIPSELEVIACRLDFFLVPI